MFGPSRNFPSGINDDGWRRPKDNRVIPGPQRNLAPGSIVIAHTRSVAYCCCCCYEYKRVPGVCVYLGVRCRTFPFFFFSSPLCLVKPNLSTPRLSPSASSHELPSGLGAGTKKEREREKREARDEKGESQKEARVPKFKLRKKTTKWQGPEHHRLCPEWRRSRTWRRQRAASSASSKILRIWPGAPRWLLQEKWPSGSICLSTDKTSQE